MSGIRRVTLIRGDGIGPEIVDAAVRVLQASGAALEFEPQCAGLEAHERFNDPLPEETIQGLKRNRVGLKGPLIVARGGPPVLLHNSNQCYATINAALRGVCGAFANVRPATRFKGVPGRFTDLSIDMIMVREVSEGIYVGREREIAPGHVEATLVTTRAASERVARFAFTLARREGRRRVCAVHKANVLGRTDGLFLRSFLEVAADYPEIEVEDLMVDAAAAWLVRDPSRFDVMVAPNQYGDILSDLAAAVVGGLGLGPGANFGGDIALFEPCHGAAPDIAGRNIANPIAMILSGVMMLEHLGQWTPASQIRRAIAAFLEQGQQFTPDLGGQGDTSAVASRIIELMRA